MQVGEIGNFDSLIKRRVEKKQNIRFCDECKKVIVGFCTFRKVGRSWGKNIYRAFHLECAKEFDHWKEKRGKMLAKQWARVII